MELTQILLLLPYLMFTSGSISRTYDEGACYQQYIPAHDGFPRAKCRRSMGGNPSIRGVFIRNAYTCCRRRSAAGWGDESGCQPCSAIRGFLLPWGDWSPCSMSCGKGEQRRYRYCSNGSCLGVRGRKQSETRTCVWKTCCPVDGRWTDWSQWSDCSESCDDGLQYRTRICSDPSPYCGGKACKGFPRQMQRCNVGPCARWSDWVTSSICSVTCGIGTIKRSRFCNNPLGDRCLGESIDYHPCNIASCAVNGGWCTWNSWSPCTTSCSHVTGTRKRSRSCRCPRPSNGGKECSGSDGDVDTCTSNNVCPIHGGWSVWSEWSSCSSERCSLITGTRYRTRTCDNPEPKYGGEKCRGRREMTQDCLQMIGCEVEGVYGKWSSWSPCTSSCGSCGIKLRTRKCFHMVGAPNTEIIGNPEIYCDSDKELGTESCFSGLCPDGTNPCGMVKPQLDEFEENNDMYSESNYSELFDGGDNDGIEGSSDETHDHEYDYSGDQDGYESSEYNMYNYDQTDVSKEFNFHENDNNFHEDDKVPASWTSLDLHSSDINHLDSLVRSLGDADSDKRSQANPETQQEKKSREDLSIVVSENYYDALGSGVDIPQPFSDMKEIAGCNELKTNLKGDKLSRAEGCCEVLSHGVENNTMYSADRLEECVYLHFQAAIDQADSMFDADKLYDNEDDVITGRGFQRHTCRYRRDEKLLQTICCLMKGCKMWKKPALRYQCKICRDHNFCQSCHNLLISG